MESHRANVALPRFLGVATLMTALLEIVALTLAFESPAATNSGAALFLERTLIYSSEFAKVGLLTLFIAAVLLHERWPHYLARFYGVVSVPRFAAYYVVNLCAFVLLALATSQVFASSDSGVTKLDYLIWLSLGFATVTSLAIGLVGFGPLYRFLIAGAPALSLALLIAVGVWYLSAILQSFWEPLSNATLWLSATFLDWFSRDPIIVVPERKLLGLGDFVVGIAPSCSGYEGVALVSAFLAIYLFLFRADIRFPQAFLLFPLGAIAIWALNSVRIAALVLVGHYWSPAVAVGGFHSQAGWLTFIFASLFMLWLLDRSQTFRRSGVHVAVGETNLAAASLIPMTTLLGASLATSAFIADFDWLYPVRAAAVAIGLYAVRSHLHGLIRRPSRDAVVAGIAVAVAWVFLASSDAEADQSFVAQLDTVPGWLTLSWLVFRFVGSVAVVPIAEELAFRGYLLCKLSKSEVVLHGKLPVSLLAVALSSFVFGLLHASWIAGTVAGGVYAAVRLRSTSIADPIAAHATSNLALFLLAATTGRWSLL